MTTNLPGLASLGMVSDTRTRPSVLAGISIFAQTEASAVEAGSKDDHLPPGSAAGLGRVVRAAAE